MFWAFEEFVFGGDSCVARLTGGGFVLSIRCPYVLRV
jgi:hypothetical protein